MNHTRNSVTAIALVALFIVAQFAPTVATQLNSGGSIDSETTATVDFPRGISFSSKLAVDDLVSIGRVELYYRPAADKTLQMALVPADAVQAEESIVQVDIRIDLQSNFLPSGIELIYFWRVHQSGGSFVDSAEEQVSWIDNRFDWKTARSAQVALHYYDLSESFANAVVQAAQDTVTDLEERFDLGKSTPFAIWVYASTTDFRAAQLTNSREAVAGASYPGDYVIHAVIRDGNDQEVGRTITHEVSHQVLFQATTNPYTRPPLWFDEGMATHAQTSGMDGYLRLAQTAAANGGLFELASLSSGFPFQADKAAIAYAVSWSAVEFIQATWGDDGIARLIDAFATGQPIEAAIVQALGIDSEGLDVGLRNWLLSHDPGD